jgi:hypothetical protein
LDDTLDDYRKIISEIGTKLNFFSCEDLRNYLRDKDSDVDFIKFSRNYIKTLNETGRAGAAGNQTRNCLDGNRIYHYWPGYVRHNTCLSFWSLQTRQRNLIPALPCLRFESQTGKPMPISYPKSSISIGDHIRKKRMELKLLQRPGKYLWSYGRLHYKLGKK